jgi:hypothetical protein
MAPRGLPGSHGPAGRGSSVLGIALVWDLFSGTGSAAGRWRRLLVSLGVFAAAGVPYFLWRWSYCGALLPNTYYAKVNHDPAVVAHGLYYIG